MLYIKLIFKSESNKAYQLENGSWIPKSVLDGSKLKHPYYEIKPWWFNIQFENIRTKPEDFKYLDRKKLPTEEDIKYSKNIILGLKPLIIPFMDLPIEIKEQYTKYHKNKYSNLNTKQVDWDNPIISESMNFNYH